MQSVKIKNKALLAIKDAYNETLTITDDTISYKKTWAINKYLVKDEKKKNQKYHGRFFYYFFASADYFTVSVQSVYC